MMFLLLYATLSLKAETPTSITFTLDEPCKTSAGVFLANGTLVRTLWSKVPYYAAGNYTAIWDGLDDNSNAVASGTYEIKLLQHNTEYVWNGVIGNTSAAQSGPTVQYQNHAMQGMSVSGGVNFYCTGYSENKYPYRSFLTNAPQQLLSQWCWDISQFNQIVNQPGIQYNSWVYTCADSNWVYFACPSSYNANTAKYYDAPGCIIPSSIANNSGPVYFTNSVLITNGPGDSYPSGIYAGTQPGLSGIAVQLNGPLLAASSFNDNAVYLYGKYTGSLSNTISVHGPQGLSFGADSNLYVISSNTATKLNQVICYANTSTSPTVALTITTFSNALAVAAHPFDRNLILVADGAGSQQVKAINESGVLQWTCGLRGGMASNGVSVLTNAFWFSYEGVAQTFLCYNWDGSFWVGDEENHRYLHFSAAQEYLEQLMFQPWSYSVCACQNNPNRVFNEFLEFNVNYTNALSNGWTLVNNWKVNMPANIAFNNSGCGLYQVTTFPNGRTYGFVQDLSLQFGPYELVELTNSLLRLTGIHPSSVYGLARLWLSLGSDGSLYSIPAGTAKWYKADLIGYDANNNPLWGGMSLIASGRELSTDPVPLCCSGYQTAAISSNNIMISYNTSLNNAWHFGGLRIGGSTNWLWEAGPSYNLNGCGTYEISNGLTYAGDMVHAVDRNVVFGFHGEFFRHQGEASQHMHFYDDGLFVGEFGEALNGHSVAEGAIAGFAGNAYSPDFIKTTAGDYYYWVNDESGHGPQRWQFVNARNIREQIGSGALGEVIVLTDQNYGFPAGVNGQNGNRSGELFWRPVRGASSYNIYYSLRHGGPFNILAGNTSGTNYTVSGLTNGQTYYFAVTAILAGGEGVPSEQVEISPFDTSQAVLCAGSITEGGQTPVVDVSSRSSIANEPSMIGTENQTGVFTPRDLVDYGYGALMNTTIGTQGYLIYDWGGAGSNLTNLSSSFTITKGSGWVDAANLTRQYRVDNVLGTNMGLSANPYGTINIGVNDLEFHYLTVVSPAVGRRQFILEITSTNGASAFYSITNDWIGHTYTFQFLFRGDITLTANASGGNAATVQGLFLDNAAVVGMPNLPPPPSLLSPPTDLRKVNPRSGSWKALVRGQSLGSALYNTYTGAFGLCFTCTANATCQALGRWVVAGNIQPHVVALCSSAGAVLAYATVTTSGVTPGTYAYASLAAPYSMKAGSTYYILSQETIGGDQWYGKTGNTVTCTSLAGSVADGVASGTLPASISECASQGGTENQSCGPVNMMYTIP
jgi:hypothetical protein